MKQDQITNTYVSYIMRQNRNKGYKQTDGESKSKRAVQAISSPKPPLTRGTSCEPVTPLSIATGFLEDVSVVGCYTQFHSKDDLRCVQGAAGKNIPPFTITPVYPTVTRIH
ncbi:hypothetical protein ACFL2S_12740 [Thermodesulfobacteriota bacterium]